VNGLLQDLRYARRQLRKSPGFATVAILTLALGVGANTAILSLLDQALLRSLPVEDPNRLVLLRYSGEDSGHSSPRGDEHLYFSYPMYRDLRDRNSVFNGLIATASAQVGVQWHNQPELAFAELISGNYYDVASPVVVLGFDYWQRRFGADRRVLNQSISINGHPFTGLSLSLLFGHAVRSQLFGISNTDPLTFGVVIVLVAAVALVSAVLPACRSAKVDPNGGPAL